MPRFDRLNAVQWFNLQLDDKFRHLPNFIVSGRIQQAVFEHFVVERLTVGGLVHGKVIALDLIEAMFRNGAARRSRRNNRVLVARESPDRNTAIVVVVDCRLDYPFEQAGSHVTDVFAEGAQLDLLRTARKPANKVSHS